MITKTLVILPILAALISGLAFFSLNPITAQNMSTPETNMTAGTNMTNATMGGNVTGAINMTNASAPTMTNSS